MPRIHRTHLLVTVELGHLDDGELLRDERQLIVHNLATWDTAGFEWCACDRPACMNSNACSSSARLLTLSSKLTWQGPHQSLHADRQWVLMLISASDSVPRQQLFDNCRIMGSSCIWHSASDACSSPPTCRSQRLAVCLRSRRCMTEACPG